MSGVATAAVAVSAYSAYKGRKAASRAARSQERASMAGIEEQRRQFDAIQELLSPYVEAGTGAIAGQQDLIGLNGPEAQASAIESLKGSPQYQTLVQQGEEALLQNASATGGLRGGNLQGALAQYRPQILSQLIESQYGKLGGLANLGQASAAGVGAAGQNTASNIANLLSQAGAAKAGGILGQAQATANFANDLGQVGIAGLMGAF